MNEVVLRGRIVAAPRLQCLPDEESTPVCGIRVAVDRDLPNSHGEYESDLIDCRIWGEYGKKKAGSCSKGDLVELIGVLRVDEWKDEHGYRSHAYVRVDFIRRVKNVAGTRVEE